MNSLRLCRGYGWTIMMLLRRHWWTSPSKMWHKWAPHKSHVWISAAVQQKMSELVLNHICGDTRTAAFLKREINCVFLFSYRLLAGSGRQHGAFDPNWKESCVNFLCLNHLYHKYSEMKVTKSVSSSENCCKGETECGIKESSSSA